MGLRNYVLGSVLKSIMLCVYFFIDLWVAIEMAIGGLLFVTEIVNILKRD